MILLDTIAVDVAVAVDVASSSAYVCCRCCRCCCCCRQKQLLPLLVVVALVDAVDVDVAVFLYL